MIPLTNAVPVGLVSIHDLMPSTMPAVRRTLALLRRKSASPATLAPTVLAPATLLVVPGSGWNRADIGELKALQQAGHALAGHGWLHRIERYGSLYHRIHGLTLSRRVAEHLALNADGIVRLINRCHDWFGDNGLDSPMLYVPPAWAMGAISIDRLAKDCPFRLYETFTGVIDADTRELTRIPMLGYEADAPLRVPIIRAWNALNRHWARRTARTTASKADSKSGNTQGLLRIGIHPRDPELRLRGDLIRDLETYRTARDYRSLCQQAQPLANI